MSGQYDSYGSGSHYPPPPQGPQGPPQPYNYGPPPGYQPPPPHQPQFQPQHEPPRQRPWKKIAGWVGVVLVGAGTTAFASIMVNRGGSDDNTPAANQSAVGVPAGPTQPQVEVSVTAAPTIATKPSAPEVPAAPPAPKKDGRFAATGDPKTWPDACDLVTDADLKVILPTATVIERRGVKRDKGASGTGENTDVLRSTSCKYSVQASNQDEGSSPVKFEVNISNIDPTPKVHDEAWNRSKSSAQRLNDDYKAFNSQFGADDSYFATQTVHLRKGGYVLDFKFITGTLLKPDDMILMSKDWVPAALPKIIPLITAKI